MLFSTYWVYYSQSLYNALDVGAGSSAGAGSEVYHVYRHLRRRENIRQQWIQEEAEQEQMEDEFQMKLAANRQADQERTEKKRAKRFVGPKQSLQRFIADHLTA